MDKEERDWAAALLHRVDLIAKTVERQNAILDAQLIVLRLLATKIQTYAEPSSNKIS
jgi:hypothetical protein